MSQWPEGWTRDARERAGRAAGDEPTQAIDPVPDGGRQELPGWGTSPAPRYTTYDSPVGPAPGPTAPPVVP
ncbi:MAG: hypothetical protein M3Q27_16760, partial [Actinomycetota bacterium]|nr:hypothetical protein [Actinomycetota bacterium]